MDRLTRLTRLLLFQLSAELDLKLASTVIRLAGAEDRSNVLFGMRIPKEVYQAMRLPDESRPVLDVPVPILDTADKAVTGVGKVVSQIISALASLDDECFQDVEVDLEDLARRNREADEELRAEIAESLRLRRQLEARRRALTTAFCSGPTPRQGHDEPREEPPLRVQGPG